MEKIRQFKERFFTFNSKPKNIVSFSAAKKYTSRLKICFVLGGFSTIAYLVFTSLSNNKIEIHCLENPENKSIINKISEFRDKKYHRSLYFPWRLMEIIYGNIFDKREFCDYQREIIFNKEGENFALVMIKRLDSSSSCN